MLIFKPYDSLDLTLPFTIKIILKIRFTKFAIINKNNSFQNILFSVPVACLKNKTNIVYSTH